MDRLNQLRGEAGGSRDSTLDTSLPPSEAYATANESSSKYFSLSEVDSTFDISPMKDESLASSTASTESNVTESNQLVSNLSPIGKNNDLLDSYKIGKQIEAANILSGGVDIFDDNENSYDGDELIIDDNAEIDDKSNQDAKLVESVEEALTENISETSMASKDTEVVLQIDGNNVDAIDIGNGLYLYRKDGEEELAAVQIIDDDQQQPSFKFLKVRENEEGNLEVYEEIQIEVPKEVPVKEEKGVNKNKSHVPIKDINKVIGDSSCNKVDDKIIKNPQKELTILTTAESESEVNKESHAESKSEGNGKMKFSEARKSPVIGSFTPMTYHSTPNKEGIPLTKTMVDLQLHPNRHSDNVKKTIEVHTDSSKQKLMEPQNKTKDNDEVKSLVANISLKGKEKSVDIICSEKKTKIETDDNSDTLKKVIEKNDNVDNTIEKAVIDQLEFDNKGENLPKSKNKDTVESQNTSENSGKNEEENTVKDIEKTVNSHTDTTVSNKDKVGNKDKIAIRKTNEDNNLPIGEDNMESILEGESNKSVVTEIAPTEVKENFKTDDTKHNVQSNEDNKLNESPKTNNQVTLHNNGTEKIENIIFKSKDILMPNVGQKNVDEPCRKKLDDSKEKANTSSNNKKQDEETEKLTTLMENKNVNKIEHNNDNNSTKKMELNKNIPVNKLGMEKREVPITNNKSIVAKPINNKHVAVPFGKWTEANRQEFLNKIKETKVPSNNSNGKQIKNSNDLNRRDVLKKIDSQRQTNIATAKALELANIAKEGAKKETGIFSNKASVSLESKVPTKPDTCSKNKTITSKKLTKQEGIASTKANQEAGNMSTSAVIDVTKKDQLQRKEINNQDLIDKTIEDIINRPVKAQEDINNASHHQSKEEQTLDDIEIEMNKLHGIPFVERPPHELPQVSTKPPIKTYGKAESEKLSTNKPSKVPNLLPFVVKNQQKDVKENAIDVDSEEEIIEHEPITGDIEICKTNIKTKPSEIICSDVVEAECIDTSKEAIITEKDFEKFARRNSITYENCLKVNFDSNESHNVIQTVIEKDNLKTGSEGVIADSKVQRHENKIHSKIYGDGKLSTGEDIGNKTCSSKVKLAYQSVMTAKRQLEHPITIIEDKPVKVMYVDSNLEFYPSKLDVQGKDLVPVKNDAADVDNAVINFCDSLDSDITDTSDKDKSKGEGKVKSKHQRKQVLTPVEIPELELIEPEELGFDISPKKKRKIEDSKSERIAKTLVPKKSYLLGRSITLNKDAKQFDLASSLIKETNRGESLITHSNAASAIDNLVKAAALIETQSENMSNTDMQNSENQPITPIKRGRGRPRKYPLPDGVSDKNKVPSPQKRPRLIDAKVKKQNVDTEDDESSGDEMIKENWTMGKINENIVCPICSKLFRSENVVFKHVKHCTGPSPNRSDSDKSSRRGRYSQESKTRDSKSEEMEVEYKNTETNIPKKRKSKDASPKSAKDKDDIIVIEDTPIKERIDKREEKMHESRKPIRNKAPDKGLICEFCGKNFRQLSYLVSHKLQHGKDEPKKKDTQVINKSIFSCDVCKKEFRKLHHLVQHRIIHNPNAMSARFLRKSSSEQKDIKTEKDHNKQSDDPSAGFRCEPCDKSFRKLHHLVEHRETHDGINRQKSTMSLQTNIEKTAPPPQCDICKKTFRKLHHLIEHKEQHLETSSEKSDDKSVKSSLSTKDIIHECSLCYMVFPNEHSLTKHTTNCQRKKKQSATKVLKQSEETDANEEDDEVTTPEDNKTDDDIETKTIVENQNQTEAVSELDIKIPEVKKISGELNNQMEQEQTTLQSGKPKPISEKEHVEDDKRLLSILKTDDYDHKLDSCKSKTEEKTCEIPNNKNEKEIPKIVTPNKKSVLKEKIASTVTKRQKTLNVPLPVIGEVKVNVESSDDDEIRYMLNPDFKTDDTSEEKLFMRVRSIKRNSLQIERPNSKNVIKRRISLQHSTKIPRIKTKHLETNALSANSVSKLKNVTKTPVSDPVPSTDSDDSDVKYSFPKTIITKSSQSTSQDKTSKEAKKIKRKTLVEKRKSLSGLAKRKSVGKVISVKPTVKSSPLKPIKRRTADVEHRCDCGELFSSAALLSRHTSLAHTPPRIRRRRSPPPDTDTKTVIKPAPRKPQVTGKLRPSADSRKSSVRSDTSTLPTPAKTIRRSSGPIKKCSDKIETKKTDTRISVKPTEEIVDKSATVTKTGRKGAHSGVPVPEKMRKFMEKSTRRSLKPTEELVDKSATVTKTRRKAAHSGVPVPEKMRKFMEKNKK